MVFLVWQRKAGDRSAQPPVLSGVAVLAECAAPRDVAPGLGRRAGPVGFPGRPLQPTVRQLP